MPRWRQTVVVSLCVMMAFGAGVLAGRRSTPTASGRAGFEALHRVRTTKRVVALTFDDGPDPRWTPAILRELRRHGAHATFFLIGRHAEDHPDIVEDLLDAGHELGNHTYDHPDLDRLPPHLVHAQIEDGADAIERAGGPRPTLFRPPKGRMGDAVPVLADAQRYRTVLWDSCVERYVKQGDVAEGVERQLRHVGPGSIILAHDGGVPDRSRTLQALPLLLDGLRDRGYDVVTVSELLHRTASAPAERPPALAAA